MIVSTLYAAVKALLLLKQQ